MRLIDADAMIADLLTVDPQYETMIDWCCRVVDAQPTIEERKWIPCGERLPEEKREVLVSTKDGYLNIAFLETLSTGDFEWTDVIEYFQIPNVIAWMPLPEPYKEVRTDD